MHLTSTWSRAVISCQLSRTEQVKNTLNPEFATKFSLNYYFEQAQRLKFEVYDIDSPRLELSAHVTQEQSLGF